MELKYLQTFRTIINEGGFSRAAEKLNYTQSTITFQVGQLERELSTSLFEKIGRKMVLTKAGEHLIPYVDEILQSVEKLSFFEDNLSECQGDLHIGIGESLLCYLFPSVLKEFHRQAPKARLFLRSMNCYEIRNELLGGTLDLGVFYEEVGGFGSSLTAYPLGTYLVKSDVGISFLPAFTVQEELGTGELEEIPTDISGKTITAVCAHHKNRWISPLMGLFMDLCKSCANGNTENPTYKEVGYDNT